MTRLEDAVIATVAAFDPEGRLGRIGRLEGYPGVWARLDTRPHKIAAVGVRTKRNRRGDRRTLHGVALNVDIDLAGFQAIIPCGIPDKPVGSMVSLGLDVREAEVEERLGQELVQRLGAEERVARVDRSAATTSDERPLLRRLRKAGVNPDEGLAITTRKPEWLRIEAHMGTRYQSLRTLTEDLRLVTVCEEAGCPISSSVGTAAPRPSWSMANGAPAPAVSASSTPVSRSRSTPRSPLASPRRWYA